MVKSARKLIGATNPLEAEPGTIRGDYAITTAANVIHGSDSPENGVREAGAPDAPWVLVNMWTTELSCNVICPPLWLMLAFFTSTVVHRPRVVLFSEP